MKNQKLKFPSKSLSRYRALLAAAVTPALFPLAARGGDIFWSNASGGAFTTATNWSTGTVPGTADVANFSLSNTYNVIFGATITNQGINVHAGNVTLSPGGNTYTLTTAGTPVMLAGGTSVAETATVTMLTGTLNSGTSSSGDSVIGGASAAANGVNSVGTFNLGGTATWNNGDNLRVGYFGQGTLNQSGGQLVVNSNLLLGAGVGGVGRYNMTAGSALMTALGDGEYGTGTVNQSGGTITTSYLQVGAYVAGGGSSPSFGTYNLSNGASLTVLASDNIGDSGRGVFNQTGGTHVASAPLILGANSTAASGTYTLSGGLLLSNAGALVGAQGTGVFNQSGGTHTLGDVLSVGDSASGVGIYNLSGSSTLSGTKAIIGNAGSGAYNQTGGAANFSKSFYLGQSSTGTGTAVVTGGSLTTSLSIEVGYFGRGTFTQSGGVVTTPGLDLAYFPNSAGTYNLSGGTLNVGITYISDDSNAVGSFNQTGGSLTMTGSTFIASYSTNSAGTYALSNGALAANLFVVGDVGHGNFNVSGGTATVNSLQLANGNVAYGNVSVSGGTLNALTSIIVGQAAGGVATFAQGGGTVTTSFLALGASSSADQQTQASGSYALSSGTLNVATEVVGAAARGTFVQTGGANNVSTQLTVASPNATAGSYTLAGGTLNAPSVVVGLNGTFAQAGGALNLAANLLNQGSFTYSAGAFNGRLLNQSYASLNGLAVTFAPSNGVQNDGYFYLNAGQTVSSYGAGLLNNSNFQINGSVLNGPAPIVNNGNLGGYGTIAGSGGFTNNNLVTQSGGNLQLTNTGANLNFGNINLTPGYQLQVNGSGLTNAGTVALNSALVSGSQWLVNAAGGVIAGPGLISAPFSNTAGTLLAENGTLNVTSPFVNTGFIQLAGVAAALGGGAVTNAGSIQGAGTLGSAVINSGTIEPVGGTIADSGTLTNLAPGILRAATGNKLLVTQGLANNLGTISLTGGTFDNNNKPLVNTGIVTGFGTLSTGGMTNAAGGLVVFSNGQATINGTLNNAIGGTVRVTYSPALFTAAVTNNGTFKITGTTATFAAPFTNNGLYSSDPATTHFSTLSVGRAGALVGGQGDKFYVSGDFDSASTQAAAWDTADGAELHFEGAAALHVVTLTGDDRGATAAGYVDNFAWGIVAVDAGQTLDLTDGNATPGGALYTKALVLIGAPDGPDLATFIAAHVVNADATNPLNIYYDPSSAADAYLAAGTYALGNGGVATPAAVPEPATLALLAITGAGLLARKRRPR